MLQPHEHNSRPYLKFISALVHVCVQVMVPSSDMKLCTLCDSGHAHAIIISCSDLVK